MELLETIAGPRRRAGAPPGDPPLPSGLPVMALEEHLAPPLEDGLLMMERGGDSAVRFRNYLVQQAALAGMAPAARRGTHLQLARRLANVPRVEALAGQQYLAVADAVTEPEERRRAARSAPPRPRCGSPTIPSRTLSGGRGAAPRGPAHRRYTAAAGPPDRAARRPGQSWASGRGRRRVRLDRAHVLDPLELPGHPASR